MENSKHIVFEAIVLKNEIQKRLWDERYRQMDLEIIWRYNRLIFLLNLKGSQAKGQIPQC